MGPRLDACGAAAMRRRRPAPTASPDGGTYGRRYRDREQANDCGHGQDRRPAEYNLARSEQDFGYWCHGWGEAPWAPPLAEMICGIVGNLLAWEDHTCLLCTSDVAGSCPKVPLWAFACFPGRFRFIIP